MWHFVTFSHTPQPPSTSPPRPQHTQFTQKHSFFKALVVNFRRKARKCYVAIRLTPSPLSWSPPPLSVTYYLNGLLFPYHHVGYEHHVYVKTSLMQWLMCVRTSARWPRTRTWAKARPSWNWPIRIMKFNKFYNSSKNLLHKIQNYFSVSHLYL